MKHQTIQVADGIQPIVLPAGMRPVGPVLVQLARLDRERLRDFIETGIELLDLFDGDPDIEANGDEEDGMLAEDEPCAKFAFYSNGPGCKISDPDEGVDDKGEEIGAEDSFHLSWAARQSSSPGCPIADPDYSPRH